MAKSKKVVSTMISLPAGTRHKDMAEPLADGDYAIEILAVKSDGGRNEQTEIDVLDSDGHPTGEKETLLPTEFGERFYVTMNYPGDITKDHQVKDIEELLPKIVAQLRGHYGVDTVKFTKIPNSLEAGEAVNVNLKT